jgi:hypothetical protein
MVAPTSFGINFPSSGTVPSAFWEMLNWIDIVDGRVASSEVVHARVCVCVCVLQWRDALGSYNVQDSCRSPVNFHNILDTQCVVICITHRHTEPVPVAARSRA